MSLALTDTEILDLATGTLNELGRLRFNSIAERLQDYEVMSRLMKRDKVMFEGGKGIQRTIMVDHSNAAKQVGMFNSDTVNVVDSLQIMDVPWRHTTTNWSWDRREPLMNTSTEQIVDIMKVRRAQSMIALAEHLENQFWSKPSSSSDKLDIFGIDYWLVTNSSTGFNGGNPSGFTAGAGNIDSSTYTRWANYTGQYTQVSKDGLIRMMRTAMRKIRFKSPINIRDYRRGTGDRYRIYCNETTIQKFEDVGESQNENLGRDLAPFDGMMAFRRAPIVWAPEKDTDSTNPVYMVNMDWFYPVCLRGDYMRESSPAFASNQHNVLRVHVDMTWNLLCTDRRRQAVFYE